MHKRARWVVMAVLLVATAFAWASTADAQQRCFFKGKDEIVFGGTLALTGFFAFDGRWYKDTYDLWVERVNAKGGILGCKVRMILYDDQGDRKNVVGLYEKLITVDKVDVLVGPWASGLNLPASTVAEKYKLALVTGGGCATPLFTRGSSYIFTTMAGADVMHPWGMFQWFKTLPPEKRPKTIGLASMKNVWSLGVAKAVRALAADLGMKIVVDEEYPPTQADFTPIVTKLKAANPDAVFAGSFYSDGVDIVKTMAELGVDPKVLWVAAAPTHTNFVKDLGPIAEGIMSASHWEEQLPYTGNTEFAEAHRKKFRRSTYDYPATGYASLQVLEQAIVATKTLEPQKIRDYVATHEFDTIIGRQRFLPTGMPSNYIFVETQIQNGQRRVFFPENDPVLGLPVKDAEPWYPKPRWKK